MTDEQRYLFDLNGYLVVRQALPVDLVARLNAEIDQLNRMGNEEVAVAGAPRSAEVEDASCNEFTSTLLAYGGVFEELIDVPTTLPLIGEMIGDPLRLDAMHYMSRVAGNSSRLHHGYAELLAYSEYAVNRDRFECVSVKIAYALTDVGIDNGPFVVVPGSHKCNFANPDILQEPTLDPPMIQPFPCRAGDAVLFSEDLTHGALRNRSDVVRRTIFVSYAPAFHSGWGDQTVTAPGFSDGATPRQRELIEGVSPYGAPEETVFSGVAAAAVGAGSGE